MNLYNSSKSPLTPLTLASGTINTFLLEYMLSLPVLDYKSGFVYGSGTINTTPNYQTYKVTDKYSGKLIDIVNCNSVWTPVIHYPKKYRHQYLDEIYPEDAFKRTKIGTWKKK